MFNTKLFFSFLTVLSLSFGTLQAQVPVRAPQAATTNKYSADGLTKGSIANQFEYLNNMSKNNYDFKMVRKTNLEIIRKNVLDTVRTLQKEIATLKSSSSNSTQTLTALKDSVTTLESQLKQEKEKTDSISLLGIDFQKGSYHTLVWTIIIVLALAFIITLASFRKAKVDTNEHKKSVEELQQELQTLRKKSIEKEQQLKRQLLDEQMKRNS